MPKTRLGEGQGLITLITESPTSLHRLV